jgi:Flp pilus assembly protein TadD
MELWAAQWDESEPGRGLRLAIERYQGAGRNKDALRLASLGAEKWPKLGAGFTRVAVLVALRSGALETAWVRVESALERWPEDAELWFLAGRINRRLTDVDRAVAAFERVIALKPSDPSAGNDLAYLLLEQGGSLGRATALADAALELRPDCVACLDTVGVAYIESERWADALLVLGEAREREPDNAVVGANLYFLQQQLARLLKEARATSQREPQEQLGK